MSYAVSKVSIRRGHPIAHISDVGTRMACGMTHKRHCIPVYDLEDAKAKYPGVRVCISCDGVVARRQRPRVTPWDESFDDLARAILADKDAPPALLLAAFLYKHGEEGKLRALITDAVSLNEKEAA